MFDVKQAAPLVINVDVPSHAAVYVRAALVDGATWLEQAPVKLAVDLAYDCIDPYHVVTSDALTCGECTPWRKGGRAGYINMVTIVQLLKRVFFLNDILYSLRVLPCHQLHCLQNPFYPRRTTRTQAL